MPDQGDKDPSSPSDDDPLLRAIARAPSRPLEPEDEVDPVRVAHFKIVGRIGSGGMGVVYRAQDESLRREVALKLLPAVSAGNPERRQRFLREARVAASLVHPNVAVVHQVGESDGRVYIAMELVDGVTLRQRLEAGPLSIPVVRDLALQIAQGLAAAHAKGIVHRDLKPENVMVTEPGGVKLLDFGLAKSGWVSDSDSALGNADTEAQITREGDVLGSSAYMSPEQALGMNVDARSDVFSFGIVLYEMLAGRRPFGGKTLGEIRGAIAREQPVPLGAGADAGIAAVVRKCLEKRAEDRYGDAGIVVLKLAALPSVSGSGGQAQMTGRRGASSRGHALGKWTLGGLVAAVIAGSFAAFRQQTHLTPVVVPASAADSADAMSRSSNPDAQRLFDEGLRALRDGRISAARELLRQAVQRDPMFGGAELRLAILSNDGRGDEARAHGQRALALEGTLSARDRELQDAHEATLRGEDVPPAAIRSFDAYLRRFPMDDAAWLVRCRFMSVFQSDGSTVRARLLAVDPGSALALATEARDLLKTNDDQGAMDRVDRCLRAHPRADLCLQARSEIDDYRGACPEFEADVRSLLALDPEGQSARALFADALASNGQPLAAVREAMGAVPATAEGLFVFPAPALMLEFEGDFTAAEQVAKDMLERIGTDGSWRAHFTPTLVLIRAYSESGDRESAARVAEEFLVRDQAWRGERDDERLEAEAILTATMVRGRKWSPTEAEPRRAEAFKKLLTAGTKSAEAWSLAYDDVATPEEARSALLAFDDAHVSAAELVASERGPHAVRAFVIAGRRGPARAIFEHEIKTCRAVTWATSIIYGHFFLGRLDEQDGNTPSACAHYSKVLERWGHATPRSVTADEARARSRVLSCPQL